MQVRFQNTSSEVFTRLQVDMLGTAYDFDTLRPGQVTRPVPVKETYYYCYARVLTRSDTLLYQPIDYIGEKLYRRGKLTIEVQIDARTHSRTGKLVRFLGMDAARGRRTRQFKLWLFYLL